MRGLIKGLFILFSVIVITAALIKYNQPPIERPIQKNLDTNYSEEIGEKLQKTNFTQKIIVALRAAGYFPDSTIGYLIESPSNQLITIQLHNLDKFEKSTESEIQNIVNSIAENNDLQLFIVNIRLIDGH
jgi:flagellar biosynthesis/type III secretory pathway M-ring protein FliF/YscJ